VNTKDTRRETITASRFSIPCDEFSCGRPAFYIVQIHMVDICKSLPNVDPDGNHPMLLCHMCTAECLQGGAVVLRDLWRMLCDDCKAEGLAPQCASCERELRVLDDLVKVQPLVGKPK